MLLLFHERGVASGCLKNGSTLPSSKRLIILVGKLRSFIVIRLICCTPLSSLEPVVHYFIVAQICSLFLDAYFDNYMQYFHQLRH